MTAKRQLSENEKIGWLRIIRSESIGPATFRRLLQKYGTADKVIKAAPDLAKRAGRRKPLKLKTEAQVASEIEATARLGARFIASCEPDYPARLAQIPDAPPLICVLGSSTLLERPMAAIVGSRNASAVGLKLARDIAGGLGEAGITVVSGLARGIDGAAHEASLATGAIAVVGGGVDIIYPPQHEALHRNLSENGAIISERPVNYSPIGRDFPRRNRLIAGMSMGIVVIEAAQKSGSLITARYAADYGRDVFAVPGSPLDPRYQGSNQLIKDGAILAQSAEDIIYELRAAPVIREDDAPMDDLFDGFAADDVSDEDLNDLEQQLLQLLGPTPIDRNTLMRETKAAPGPLADVLMTLVLSGQVEEVSGDRYMLSVEVAG